METHERKAFARIYLSLGWIHGIPPAPPLYSIHICKCRDGGKRLSDTVRSHSHTDELFVFRTLIMLIDLTRFYLIRPQFFVHFWNMHGYCGLCVLRDVILNEIIVRQYILYAFVFKWFRCVFPSISCVCVCASVFGFVLRYLPRNGRSQAADNSGRLSRLSPCPAFIGCTSNKIITFFSLSSFGIGFIDFVLGSLCFIFGSPFIPL